MEEKKDLEVSTENEKVQEESNTDVTENQQQDEQSDNSEHTTEQLTTEENSTTEELDTDLLDKKKYPFKISKVKMATEILSVIAESQGIKPSRQELRQAAKLIGKIDRIDDSGNLKVVHKLTDKEKLKRKKKRKMEKKARKRNRGK